MADFQAHVNPTQVKKQDGLAKRKAENAREIIKRMSEADLDRALAEQKASKKSEETQCLGLMFADRVYAAALLKQFCMEWGLCHTCGVFKANGYASYV